MEKDNNLPLKVDPFRFADNALSLRGHLPLNTLERLSGSLASNDGEVAVELNFGVDEEGIRFVKGHLTTHVMLQCQRCMEPFPYEIVDDFASGIVATEEAAEELPERYDPLVASDGVLYIADMVEEELIVSLPIVAMHVMDECKVKLPLESHSGSAKEAEKDNPFKVIESLRSNKRNGSK